jgi:hypothetical protein
MTQRQRPILVRGTIVVCHLQNFQPKLTEFEQV